MNDNSARSASVTTGAAALEAVLTENDHLRAAPNGDLMIEGCAASDLLARFGSPLFALSEATIRGNYRRVRGAFASAWPEPVTILYAIKSNNNPAVRAVLHSEGAGGDCFGPGEFYATFLGGADPSKVVMNGSDKGCDDLRDAVEKGVSVNIDSEQDVDLLEKITAELGTTARVQIRLKIYVEEMQKVEGDYFAIDDLREYLYRNKWGFSLDGAQALIQRLAGIARLDMRGYHLHIGRINRDPDFRRAWAAALGEMVVELHRRTAFTPRILDIGGGWPRARDPESRSLEINRRSMEEYASTACEALLEALRAGGLPAPDLWVEPGRYIAGNAGVLLTTVGTVKRDLGFTWANLDASSNNLPRMDTSGSVYWVLPAAGLGRAMSETVTFVGGTCTDSIFGIDRASPPVERGDIFAILDAGMYAESASTQFNSMPRPATVLVNGASADLIKERETVADLFAHSRIPERLLSS